MKGAVGAKKSTAGLNVCKLDAQLSLNRCFNIKTLDKKKSEATAHNGWQI